MNFPACSKSIHKKQFFLHSIYCAKECCKIPLQQILVTLGFAAKTQMTIFHWEGRVMKKLIAIIFMLFCIISSVFAERIKGTIYDSISFDGISTEGFVYKILDTETLKEYAKTYPEINKYKGKCIEILKIYLDESQTQDFTTLRIPEEIDGFKVIKVNLGSCSIIKKNEQGYFYPYFYFKTSNLIIPASVISFTYDFDDYYYDIAGESFLYSNKIWLLRNLSDPFDLYISEYDGNNHLDKFFYYNNEETYKLYDGNIKLNYHLNAHEPSSRAGLGETLYLSAKWSGSICWDHISLMEGMEETNIKIEFPDPYYLRWYYTWFLEFPSSFKAFNGTITISFYENRDISEIDMYAKRKKADNPFQTINVNKINFKPGSIIIVKKESPWSDNSTIIPTTVENLKGKLTDSAIDFLIENNYPFDKE